MLDSREALNTKPPENTNRGPESGHLIDFSGIEGPSARQSNALTRDNETQITSASMTEFLAAQKAQMDSFLQHFGEQAETHRSALACMIDQFVGIASSLGSNVAHWLGHPAAHQGAQLYEELNRIYKRAIDAEGQCYRLKTDHQTLEKQLAEAVKERDGLRKLVDIANWTCAAKLSDDVIRGQWKKLDYNIRVMVRALTKCQIKRPKDDVTKARFESIVTLWSELLGSDDYKELLITAYLWAIVVEEIFYNGSEFRGGSSIQALKCIREHHFDRRDAKAPKRQARIELDRLKLFCNITADTPGTDFLREMKSILETALDLDGMLMGSMAILSIQWLQTGQSKSLRYDTDLMNSVAHTKELSPKTAVTFMISPVLLKMGNADGCNYDSEMVLCKASVVCE
ncbi:unnamed protein product [Fusarium graminearum]|nr:unnamed protein product [Fusarium graminearum]